MATLDLTSEAVTSACGVLNATTTGDIISVSRKFAHEITHTGVNSSGTAETGPIFLWPVEVTTLYEASDYTTATGKYVLISGKSVFVPPGARYIQVQATANTVTLSITRSPNYRGDF